MNVFKEFWIAILILLEAPLKEELYGVLNIVCITREHGYVYLSNIQQNWVKK